jgi:hypothetical protein
MHPWHEAPRVAESRAIPPLLWFHRRRDDGDLVWQRQPKARAAPPGVQLAGWLRRYFSLRMMGRPLLSPSTMSFMLGLLDSSWATSLRP